MAGGCGTVQGWPAWDGGAWWAWWPGPFFVPLGRSPPWPAPHTTLCFLRRLPKLPPAPFFYPHPQDPVTKAKVAFANSDAEIWAALDGRMSRDDLYTTLGGAKQETAFDAPGHAEFMLELQARRDDGLGAQLAGAAEA